MKKGNAMQLWISTMGAALFMLAGAAVSQAEEPIGNVDNGRKIYQDGKGDAPACASCHGTDGIGMKDMGTPRLAYQVDTYVLKQLTDFANGKRQDNVMFTMNDVAKALDPQDRRDVAAFVHTLKTPFFGSDLRQLKADGVEVGDPAIGRMIVEYGLPDHGVPACQSCHDFHGRSAGRIFPAIGGQRYSYLQHELKAFRLGATTSSADDPAARDNDPAAMMRHVAMHLTDEDIDNVAAFLTVSMPIAPGNPRAPMRQ